jgi:predicted PurR-regulated permease PerM
MDNLAGFKDQYLNKILYTAGIFAGLLILLYFLLKISHILLILFMGVLLAVILDTLMTTVMKITKVPRAVAFILVIIFLFGLTFLIGFLIGPGLVDQMVLLSQRIPQAFENIKTMLANTELGSRLMTDFSDFNRLLPPFSDVLGGISGVFSTTLGTFITIFIVFFLGIYLSLQPDYYIKKAITLIPRKNREKAETIIRMTGKALRWWLFGRFLSMLIVGLFMAVGLAIAGVPLAIALGIIAALMCFVPYIGPVLAAIPPILVAMTVDMQKVLYAIIVYLVAQILESYIITPMIQRRAVLIPPAILFTAQVIMGVIAGALGVVLATPLAVVFIIAVQKLYIHDILGDPVRILGDHSPK